MPHGFECDRCGLFVEQGVWDQVAHAELDGRGLEVVKINNPRLESDSEGADADVETYTLCEECRDAVIRVVEHGGLDE